MRPPKQPQCRTTSASAYEREEMKIGISLRRLAEARTGSPKIDMFAVRRVARFSSAVIQPARACSIRLVIDLYPLFERLSFTVKPTQSLHTSDFLQEWGSKTSNHLFLMGFLREIPWLLEVLVTRKIPDATCSRVCPKESSGAQQKLDINYIGHQNTAQYIRITLRQGGSTCKSGSLLIYYMVKMWLVHQFPPALPRRIAALPPNF